LVQEGLESSTESPNIAEIFQNITTTVEVAVVLKLMNESCYRFISHFYLR